MDGRYRIERKLGRGGMGAVYEATHIMLDKPFALKVVLQEYVLKNPGALEYFKREARTTASIRHPAVVSVTDFGVTPEDIAYLVMEYVDGVTLIEFMAERLPVDLDLLLVIFTQICAGLDSAHRKGIIHRDVKPANVLIDHSMDLGEGVKVSDFGIAGILDETWYSGQEEKGIICGTPLYMSPEQCLGERLIDQRSDVYSLGVMLYYAVTGRLPFIARTGNEVMLQQIRCTPEDPKFLNPKLPDKLTKVVLKALSKRREDRQQSTPELCAELEEAISVPKREAVAPKNVEVSAIGIDLGTSNSVCAAVVGERAMVIQVDGVRGVMPSAVSFRSKDKKVVGDAAFRRAVIDPEHTILDVKRKMGYVGHRYAIYDSFLKPEEVSAMILSKLVEAAEEELGQKINKAVITVPAHFNEEQRKATREAGEIAGLRVLKLLSEPSAAAIALGMDKRRDQTLLIYDLGGGTFDVSILRVKENSFEVVAVSGDHDLGGNDFDRLLMDDILGRISLERDIDLREADTDPEVLRALQTLRVAVKRAKEDLSETERASIDLPNLVKGESYAFEITRQEFEALAKPLVEKTMRIVMGAVSDAGLTLEDIDRLVLVGGSTRMPMVKRMLTDSIREPYVAPNVDEIVALGAAIVADQLGSSETSADTEKVFTLKEVSAHTIGVGLLEGEELVCVHLIPRNSPLPVKRMYMGSTVNPNQLMVNLPVFRGDSRSVAENDYIGELQMSIENPRDEKIPIQMELCLNGDGILEVEAAEMSVHENRGLEVVQRVKAVFQVVEG